MRPVVLAHSDFNPDQLMLYRHMRATVSPVPSAQPVRPAKDRSDADGCVLTERCLLVAKATGRHQAVIALARRDIVPQVERGPAYRCRRHAAGACPTRFRNALVRCGWSAKPQATAIWDKGAFVRSIISWARSVRRPMTWRANDSPKLTLNARAKCDALSRAIFAQSHSRTVDSMAVSM
jgi:hypothetical protein